MATATERGRHAERPSQIPRAGWRDILIRTWHEVGNDHLSLIAAGIGFYALLALFPGIAAMVAIWGLAFDPQQIGQSGTNPAGQNQAQNPKDKKQVKGVFTIQNDKSVFVPVETGITGENDIEIKSGLKEGQEIVTGPYRQLPQRRR